MKRYSIDKQAIIEKVTNDTLGKFISLSWKKLIDPYTPYDTGTLSNNVEINPHKIHYKSVYARYIYNGEVYVDPVTKASGFYIDGVGWRSRRGVKKIPGGRSFNFTKDHNPKATDHWDEVAAKSGQLEKLYKTINKKLRNEG